MAGKDWWGYLSIAYMETFVIVLEHPKNTMFSNVPYYDLYPIMVIVQNDYLLILSSDLPGDRVPT